MEKSNVQNIKDNYILPKVSIKVLIVKTIPFWLRKKEWIVLHAGLNSTFGGTRRFYGFV